MRVQFAQILVTVAFGFLLVYVCQALGQRILAKTMKLVMLLLAVAQAVQMVDGFFAGLQDSKLGRFLEWLESKL